MKREPVVAGRKRVKESEAGKEEGSEEEAVTRAGADEGIVVPFHNHVDINGRYRSTITLSHHPPSPPQPPHQPH